MDSSKLLIVREESSSRHSTSKSPLDKSTTCAGLCASCRNHVVTYCENCNATIRRVEPGDDTPWCTECDVCLCPNCMRQHKEDEHD